MNKTSNSRCYSTGWPPSRFQFHSKLLTISFQVPKHSSPQASVALMEPHS